MSQGWEWSAARAMPWGLSIASRACKRPVRVSGLLRFSLTRFIGVTRAAPGRRGRKTWRAEPMAGQTYGKGPPMTDKESDDSFRDGTFAGTPWIHSHTG